MNLFNSLWSRDPWVLPKSHHQSIGPFDRGESGLPYLFRPHTLVKHHQWPPDYSKSTIFKLPSKLQKYGARSFARPIQSRMHDRPAIVCSPDLQKVVSG